jgi:hypothetical protein
MKKKMKIVRIDREKWIRGKYSPKGEFVETTLWDPNIKAGCCLGHAIHQVSGRTWEQLSYMPSPQSILEGESFLTIRDHGYSEVYNNALADAAMEINDDYSISDKIREKKLINLFRKNNVKLEFYN